MPAFARGVGELEMTVEVASRAGPGERRSRCAEETATVPREAASQATLDALLCELLPRQGCWSDEGYLWLTDHRTDRSSGGLPSVLPGKARLAPADLSIR